MELAAAAQVVLLNYAWLVENKGATIDWYGETVCYDGQAFPLSRLAEADMTTAVAEYRRLIGHVVEDAATAEVLPVDWYPERSIDERMTKLVARTLELQAQLIEANELSMRHPHMQPVPATPSKETADET